MSTQEIYIKIKEFYNSDLNNKKSILNSSYKIISINLLENKENKSCYINLNENINLNNNLYKILFFNQNTGESFITQLNDLENFRVNKKSLTLKLKNNKTINFKL